MVPVTDLAPAPRGDPKGSGTLTTLLPLILLSIVLARCSRSLSRLVGAVRLVRRCRHRRGPGRFGPGRRPGTFTGAYLADAGVLALLVFGIAGTSAGLTRHTSLRPVEGLFALTMLLLGIPSAGALVPPELLPQPWRMIGPALPPASALDALRGVTFFGGAAIGTSMAVLAGWAAFGALLASAAGAHPGQTTRSGHRTNLLHLLTVTPAALTAASSSPTVSAGSGRGWLRTNAGWACWFYSEPIPTHRS